MKTIKNLIDTRKGERALILCAGASVRTYRKEIWEFIQKERPFA